MPYKDPIKNKEFIRRWKAENKDYLRKQAFNNYLKRTYNITAEQYEQMAAKQNYTCWICKASKRLQVDHSHSRYHVRGLLCIRCNCLVGYYENTKDMAAEIEKYLSNFK